MSSLHNFRQGTHYLLSDIEGKSHQNWAFLLFVDFLVFLVLLFSDFGSKPTFDIQEAISRLTSGPMLPGELPRSSRAQLNDKASEYLHRVTAHLLKQEARETNAWKIDDLRVSRMTVGYARHGHTDPWNFAFWMYYGKTLPNALIAWAERDRLQVAVLESIEAMNRMELAVELSEALPPRKPMHTVKSISREDRA